MLVHYTINVIKQINCEETTFAVLIICLNLVQTERRLLSPQLNTPTRQTGRNQNSFLWFRAAGLVFFYVCWQPPIGRCNLHGHVNLSTPFPTEELENIFTHILIIKIFTISCNETCWPKSWDDKSPSNLFTLCNTNLRMCIIKHRYVRAVKAGGSHR